MATRHSLKLEVIDTSCENVLRIADMSVYVSGLDVDCPRLDILVPGAAQPVFLTDTTSPAIDKDFDIKLTPYQLCPNIAVTDQTTLPDGVYTLRYSVSPNDKVLVEYFHLRTTKLLNEYYKELCKVRLTDNEPTAEEHQRLHDLRYVKMMIDGAKAKVEYCHSPKAGAEMYQYAQKLLAKYQHGSCLTCK